MSPLFLATIYLFYGASFFAIGVAIISRLRSFDRLKIAGIFWLLALFAFIHAIHEWMELLLVVELVPPEIFPQVRLLSLALLLLSFLFLATFGISLFRELNPASWRWLAWLPPALLVILFLLTFLHITTDGQLDFEPLDYHIRNLFAITATLLTGSGLILYSRQLHRQGVNGAGNFTGAGATFLIYGFFTGIVPSSAVIMMLPVQFWRGLSAFIILHFIMYALDLFQSERDEEIGHKLRDAALNEKLSSVGRLAAGVAHEINNPLANVSLQLELLHQDPAVAALPAKTRDRLRAVERNVEKSASIAQELLLLSGNRREEAGQHEKVNLNDALNTAWQSLAARHLNHRLHNHLPAKMLVSGIPLKLEQLFRNLLGNALDAMPGGGEIEVYGHEMADKVVVSLFDRGDGFNPEDKNRILEPFFSTKAVGKGSGLGLAICYAIMMQHDGTIELAPRRDGKGTVATLTFHNRSARRGKHAK